MGSRSHRARALARGNARAQRGFTLVELVVTLVLSAIVVSFMAMFMVTPVNAYLAQDRRTELADSANNATRLLNDDIRSALPESVRQIRNGSLLALELLQTTGVARFRAQQAPPTAAIELDFNVAETQFNTIGAFGVLVPHGVAVNYAYLAVGHAGVGVPGKDAYALSNVITPAGTAIQVTNTAPDEDTVLLNPAMTFTNSVNVRNVFFVSGPVTYLCDEAAHTLTRFWGYSISPSITANDTAGKLNGAGASSSLVARDVSSCALTYVAGTAQHGGLVTLRLVFSRDGENVIALHQVQVENVP